MAPQRGVRWETTEAQGVLEARRVGRPLEVVDVRHLPAAQVIGSVALALLLVLVVSQWVVYFFSNARDGERRDVRFVYLYS